MKDVMLSIVVITYNHEKYVRGCIESILQQEVNFKYEILIGDDCSKDQTVKIIQELIDENPGIIKLLTHEKNVGAARNIYDLFMLTKGKYITRLEGDDYWEKTDQLQFSIDFLENNPEYIGITRSSKTIDEEGNIRIQEELRFPDQTATLKDYLKSKQTGTQLFRNFYKDSREDFTIIYTAQRMVAECIIGYLTASRGRLYITNKSWEVKRTIRKKGASNYNSLRSQYQMYEDIMDAWDNLAEYTQKYDFSRNRVGPATDIVFCSIAAKNYGYIRTVFKRLPAKAKILTVLRIFSVGARKVICRLKKRNADDGSK